MPPNEFGPETFRSPTVSLRPPPRIPSRCAVDPWSGSIVGSKPDKTTYPGWLYYLFHIGLLIGSLIGFHLGLLLHTVWTQRGHQLCLTVSTNCDMRHDTVGSHPGYRVPSWLDYHRLSCPYGLGAGLDWIGWIWIGLGWVGLDTDGIG